jgi:hypothetical protein
MHGLHIGMLLLDAWTDAWISQQNRPGQGRTINIIIQQSSSERAQYTYYIVMQLLHIIVRKDRSRLVVSLLVSVALRAIFSRNHSPVTI